VDFGFTRLTDAEAAKRCFRHGQAMVQVTWCWGRNRESTAVKLPDAGISPKQRPKKMRGRKRLAYRTRKESVWVTDIRQRMRRKDRREYTRRHSVCWKKRADGLAGLSWARTAPLNQPPDAGISPKQCPPKWAAERGHVGDSLRIRMEMTRSARRFSTPER